MRIIVNADDLGGSQEINDRIFELMGRGRITSATILANSPELDTALRTVPLFPRHSFGIHLNATVYRPLTSNPDLTGLLGASGCFERKLEKVVMTQKLRRALFREFCAQMETLIRGGIQISHIDSHHHIHTLPGVLPVIKAVQMKFRIRKMRITQNWYEPGLWPGRRKLFQKRLYNAALRYMYATTTTDGFTDFLTFYTAMQSIERMPFRSMELMVHPGPASYAKETDALMTDWQKARADQIQMINYAEL